MNVFQDLWYAPKGMGRVEAIFNFSLWFACFVIQIYWFFWPLFIYRVTTVDYSPSMPSLEILIFVEGPKSRLEMPSPAPSTFSYSPAVIAAN